jgi:prepilin-type N-terminal cleavage/methylation domain-containing protein
MFHKFSSKGFTLVELLIVITLVGILATMGSGAYMKSINRARDGQARTEISEIHKALELYYAVNGNYPTLEQYQAIGDFDNSTYFQSGSMPRSKILKDFYPYSYNLSTGVYCVCSHELEADPGNSADTACSYLDSGVLEDRPYFCMSSSQ